jgi:hypothetical protein
MSGEREKFRRKHGLGATGQFPHGKIDERDQGEVRIAITVDHEQQIIIIDLGKDVSWLAFDKAMALELADAIKSFAEKLE